MVAARTKLRRACSHSATEYETLKYFPLLPKGHLADQNNEQTAAFQPRTSSDTTLTGLVQLAAHQTGTERSFIFAYGATHDHVVAEATPTLPLAADLDAADCEGGIWFCGAAFKRAAGDAPGIFARSEVFENAGLDRTQSTHPILQIADFTNDPRFATSPFAAAGRPARSYASVPIRTRRGIQIGVLCVVGTSPRVDWSSSNTDVLRNLSRSIMGYLEMRRTAGAYRRHLRMNRGIGSFIEGHGSLAGWQDGPNVTAFADVRHGEGTLNESQQAAQEDERIREVGISTSAQQPETPPTPTEPAISSVYTPRTPSSPHAFTKTDYFGPDAASRSTRPTVAHLPNSTTPRGEVLPQDAHNSNVFSRASNLVREAIEIEGCLFVDAQARTFAALSSQTDDSNKQLQSFSPCSASSSSSSGGGSGGSGTEDGHLPATVQCQVLGFSTSDTSSIDSPSHHHGQLDLHEKLLAKLLRRYPEGKIFNFDAAGELQSSDSSEDDFEFVNSSTLATQKSNISESSHARRSKPWARDREASTILKAFPGARSVAFVPLRDHKRDRWFSGAFAYTFNPGRTFTFREELTYLRAFGMLAMSETHRAEVLTAQKAKDDVLNSISHELRSPLHGVVLGVELLQETSFTVFQGGLLHSIETCGRTLMDTIDHLLDFTKINNYTQPAGSRRGERPMVSSSSSRRQIPGRVPRALQSTYVNVSLDVLAEEVIESVFTGHTYQSAGARASQKNESSLHSTHRNSRANLDRHTDEIFDVRTVSDQHDSARVSISLCIEPSTSWVLRTQPGAIRRLLMNLFSNALKYTTDGSICIFLNQQGSDRKSRSGNRLVTITVADTGKGISEDFLRNDLYKPFSQETTLSSGTGLGLSIVKQVASSLNGSVRVESALGRGTTASFTIPMMPASQATTSGEGSYCTGGSLQEDRAFANRAEELRGLRLHLVGYTPALPATEPQTQNVKIVEATCRDWLQMTVISAQDVQDGAIPDVILVTKAAMPHFHATTAGSPPCVVVCSDAFEAHDLATSTESTESAGTYEFIAQP